MNQSELKKVLSDHEQWVSGNGGKKADLTGANLSGADLRFASLGYTDLRDANLRDADLRFANLRFANLSNANLTGANLSYVNLSGANLRGANLGYTDLRGTNLQQTKNFYLLPVQDPRGCSWPHAIKCDDSVWRIRAGCRFFTIDEAREHWGEQYGGNRRIGDMYLAAVDWLERVIDEDNVQGGE